MRTPPVSDTGTCDGILDPMLLVIHMVHAVARRGLTGFEKTYFAAPSSAHVFYISDMLVSLTGLRKQRKVIDVTRRYGTAEGLTETRLNCGNLLEKVCCFYSCLSQLTWGQCERIGDG